MALSDTRTSSFSVALPDEHATRRLAIDIANALEAGDVVTLSGDLGAGKTTLARTLIRYLGADPDIEVPSPTFTLMQRYDLPQFPVVHVDLYRVSGPAELAELGLEDLPDQTVMLLEWPDRADGLCPRDRLRHASAARRPHGGDTPIHRRERLQRGGSHTAARRRLDAVIRAARAGRQARAPDEFPAPSRWAARARRQAV